MTQQEATPVKGTMAQVMAMVEVTAGQGVQMLNTMAEANADKDPSLQASFNAAIEALQNGSFTVNPQKTAHHESRSTRS